MQEWGSQNRARYERGLGSWNHKQPISLPYRQPVIHSALYQRLKHGSFHSSINVAPIAMQGRRGSAKKIFQSVPVSKPQPFTGIFARERSAAATARAIVQAAALNTANIALLAAKALAEQAKSKKAAEDAANLTDFVYEHFDVSGFQVHANPSCSKQALLYSQTGSSILDSDTRLSRHTLQPQF